YTNDKPDVSMNTPGPKVATISKWSGDPTPATPLLATSRPVFSCEAATNTNRGAQVVRQGNLAGGNTDPEAGCYVTRSFRYRSDELIDKSDLNRSTTEFA